MWGCKMTEYAKHLLENKKFYFVPWQSGDQTLKLNDLCLQGLHDLETANNLVAELNKQGLMANIISFESTLKKIVGA